MARFVRAQDPGWERARTAVRVMGALVLGVVPALGVLALGGRPLLLAGLAGITALLGDYDGGRGQ